MAKLTRVTGKVFGSQASPTGDVDNGAYIGQFGSAQAGTYVGTDDVAMIQNLPAWEQGWIGACVEEDQLPPLPERTGVDKVLSYQECYLLQQGMPEWDSATTYYIDNFCSYNGIIYKSLTDINLNNQPDTSVANWEVYGKISQYTKFAINKGNPDLLINNSNELAFDVDNNNPLTYTNIMGETRTVDSLLPIDVSGTPYFYENFTKVGTPTINNGVVSGFTASDYLTYTASDMSNGSWEILRKITTGSYWSADQYIQSTNQFGFSPIKIYLGTDKRIYLLCFSANANANRFVNSYSTSTLSDNTTYWIKASFDGTNAYKLELSTDGVTYNTEITTTNSTKVYYINNMQNELGVDFSGTYGVIDNPFKGSIDLKECYDKVNNEIVWSCMRSTSDGTFKVALPQSGNQPYLFNGNVFIQDTQPYKAYNIIGSPTINNGVASGFSTSNYLTLKNDFTPLTNNWEITIPFTTGNDITTSQDLYSSGVLNSSMALLLNIGSGDFRYSLSDTGSNWTICSNVSGFSLTTETNYILKFGFNGSEYYCKYSTDNGETWTNGTGYTSSTPINSNSPIGYIGVRRGTGNAFIGSIDVGNMEFRVQDNLWINPQEQYTAQLDNISNWQDFNDVLLLDSSVTVAGGVITALEQPKYNNPHITPNKSYISGLGMPSSKYIDLTLLSSGSQYVAPANGWFFFGADSSACLLTNNTKKIEITNGYIQNFAGCNAYIPVTKNDLCTLSYSSSINYKFRFIYAEGEV